MKRLITIALLALLTTATSLVAADSDITRKPSCSYCGMDREKFGHSRMLITYDDGTETATCSLHCSAVDMAVHLDRAPAAINVADYGTKQLIDGEKAHWVIGGSKSGVMSARAKWAFAQKNDAEAFVAANGGKLASFEEAIKAAYEDLYADTKMIRERRKMRRHKMEQAPTNLKPKQ